jgi:hypothetical protein
VHTRTLRIESVRTGPAELAVTGHLVDERPPGATWFGLAQDTMVHDMRVTLHVRHPDLTITRVAAEMVARPYTLCADAIEPLHGLVGLSVARGFTRAVNERFGRQQGCAHLTALVHAMAPAVRQAAGVFRDAHVIPTTEDELWFVNTCQAWREGGLLHQRLVAKDVAGLRALTPPRAGRP